MRRRLGGRLADLGEMLARMSQGRSQIDEEGRDLLARAQAALLDEQPAAALRSLERLHGLLVPLLDQVLTGACDQANAPEHALSSGIGLPGLYRELPDLDVEREGPVELLAWHAARAREDEVEALLARDGFAPLGGNAGGPTEALAAQWAALRGWLSEGPLPGSRWWLRLSRSGAGSLGDLSRVQVQRGAVIVMERLPPDREPAGSEADLDGELTTELGAFRGGDRMTLQVPLPLPGRLAILHGVGDDRAAELTLLLPRLGGEDEPRRAREVVEVVGELAAVPGAAEHAMVVCWAPEFLPPGWIDRVLRERRLPPEGRTFRYRYQVA